MKDLNNDIVRKPADLKPKQSVIVPAITPLTESLQLDLEAVENLFANFYNFGISPFILGTTGESASLPNELRKDYVKAASELKQANTTLYAGISSNCFAESVVFANYCFDNGIDACAVTLPSIYQLSADAMSRYFEALADAIKGPLIIYNIPATTHMSIPLEVLEKLSHHPGIIATKDSERDDDRLKRSLELWKDRPDFRHFIGWAGRSGDALLAGSSGLIPSTGNLLPGIYADMLTAASKQDVEEVYRLQKLSDVFGDLYQKGRSLAESLWALKVLMQHDGICKAHVMLPLFEGTTKDGEELIDTYRSLLEQHSLV